MCVSKLLLHTYSIYIYIYKVFYVKAIVNSLKVILKNQFPFFYFNEVTFNCIFVIFICHGKYNYYLKQENPLKRHITSIYFFLEVSYTTKEIFCRLRFSI